MTYVPPGMATSSMLMLLVMVGDLATSSRSTDLSAPTHHAAAAAISTTAATGTASSHPGDRSVVANRCAYRDGSPDLFRARRSAQPMHLQSAPATTAGKS